MINASRGIAERKGKSHVTRYEPVPAVSRFLGGLWIVPILVFCATLWAVPGKAQELSGPTSNSSGLGGGWWSAEKGDSAASRRLQIGMAQVTRFETSDTLRNPSSERTDYRAAEPIEGAVSSSPSFGLGLDAGISTASRLADPVSLTPSSLLSLIATDYAAWESNLSDSRSLVDVNRMSVYPIAQIDHAWHLPIALCISPLRGSNAW